MFSKDTKILIADDSSVARQMLIGFLKDLGYTDFIQAKNGKEAFELLERQSASGQPIQLIISDLQMPESTGMDFLTKIKSDERFAEIPFVVSSVESQRSMILSVTMMGSSNYLLKPVNLESLKSKLELVYKRHRKA